MDKLIPGGKKSLAAWGKTSACFHQAETPSWQAGLVFMTKCTRFKWSLNPGPAQGPLSHTKETQHQWLCKYPSLLLLFPGVQIYQTGFWAQCGSLGSWTILRLTSSKSGFFVGFSSKKQNTAGTLNFLEGYKQQRVGWPHTDAAYCSRYHE